MIGEIPEGGSLRKLTALPRKASPFLKPPSSHHDDGTADFHQSKASSFQYPAIFFTLSISITQILSFQIPIFNKTFYVNELYFAGTLLNLEKGANLSAYPFESIFFLKV